jgi:hypothetical protein
MKRRISIVLITLLLTLLLVVPVAATKPAEASGHWWMSAPPQNRTWRTAGNTCIIEVDLTLSYDGTLDGISHEHFWIKSHAPCPPDGPVAHKYYETIHVRGTFDGKVDGRSGTFTFTENARNIPTGLGDYVWIGKMAILSGTGELANLHGIVDLSNDVYTGRIHFDPKQ